MHTPAVVVMRPLTSVHSCAVNTDIATAQVEAIAVPARQIAEAR